MFGYGNGTTTQHNDSAYDREGRRVRKTFDNSMTAHVWAQFSQSFGQSNNGNLYFHGRAIYSYGSHYVAGYLLPANGDAESVGVALWNCESYSVSTSGHVSDVRAAVRHLSPVGAEAGLTESVRIIEAGIELAANKRELAAHVAPRLSKLWADSRYWIGRKAAAAILAACAVRNPEKRAAAMESKAFRAEAARKAARDAQRKAEMLDLAKRAAATVPAVAMAEGERLAKAARRYSWESERDAWAERARQVFRATKVARAEGWTRIARDAGTVYKAMREALPAYELAEIRRNRVAAWGADKRDMRAALELAATGQRAHKGGVYQAGLAGKAYELGQGIKAAERMAERLTGDSAWAAPAARLMGHDAGAIARRLDSLCDRLAAAVAEAEGATRRERARAEIKALRAARDMPADALPATRATVLRDAARALSGYVPTIIGESRFEPHKALSGAARVVGHTPESLRPLYERLKAEAAEAEAEQRAADAAQKIADKARAFELWRAGESVPHDLRAYMPRADSKGRAYVRAVGVERDDSGQITAGTLETSQGATAPLRHAIRVFAFVKQCRDTGKGWRANGRTLRVGHFQVDKITAQGDFVAGCHAFAWAEIAGLAESLGLAELAAADTTESRV